MMQKCGKCRITMYIFDSLEDVETIIQKIVDAVTGTKKQNGFTVILDNNDTEHAQYQDAPLFYGQQLATRDSGNDMLEHYSQAFPHAAKPSQTTAAGETLQKGAPKANKQIPEQIRRMRNLYQYGDGSFRQMLKNFYVQGKFMEEYEDMAPWSGEIYESWPTYHNLTLAQLRGYFTWRTELRKGNYQKHCTAFSLMYFSELVNGIGTASAEDGLSKMQAFEEYYINAGLSSGYMRYSIRQWMFDFAVINRLAPEIASQYADREMLERDAKTEILRKPEHYSDQEVFDALRFFSGKKIDTSIIIQKEKEAGVSLFAAVWRQASVQYRQGTKSLFGLCFGRKYAQYWYPLNNTLYYREPTQELKDYGLNSCRKYSFKKGWWYEHSYRKWYDGLQHIQELIHEADRRFRLYLKMGRPLKERKEEAWAVPYIEAVIAVDKQARLEAARPKITINFSGLDKIRHDALETQGCLLTEEDTHGTPDSAVKRPKDKKHDGSSEYAGNTVPADAVDKTDQKTAAASVPLDSMQIQLLRMLLRGEPIQSAIAAQHGMPSVIADAINEALFDHIGDMVVECSGATITLVEDYRSDMSELLGEND